MAGSIPNSNYENYDYLGTLESGKMTANPSGASGSAFSAMSFASSITSLLGVGAQLADMDAENKAIQDSMESAIDASKFKMNQQAEQIQDLERITGDKLTASGLEELKAESRLKAGAAETGGTMNADVMTTTGMNKLHRDAVIQREGSIAVKNSMNAMTSEKLNLDNQLTMMASRTASPLKGFLATMNAGISGFNNGLSYMSSADKQQLFNIEPSYKKA